jgi:biotin carboxyl carrier protein
VSAPAPTNSPDRRARLRLASLSPEHGCELLAMAHLQELDLAGNDLANLAAVLGELQHLAFLTTLTLRDCPCANEADYRLRVLASMPFLTILDNRVVGDAERREARARFATDKGSGAVLAPLTARVLQVMVTPGQSVQAGERLLVLEAMKMEHTLTAPITGVVRGLRVQSGGQALKGALLLQIEAQVP